MFNIYFTCNLFYHYILFIYVCKMIVRTIGIIRSSRGFVFDVPKARSHRAKLGPKFPPSRRTLPLLAFGSRSTDQPAGAIPPPGSVCSCVENRRKKKKLIYPLYTRIIIASVTIFISLNFEFNAIIYPCNVYLRCKCKNRNI